MRVQGTRRCGAARCGAEAPLFHGGAKDRDDCGRRPSRTLTAQDDFGMEEGAGDAGRDGDQVGLAGEDFDLGVAGEVGEIDGASEIGRASCRERVCLGV